MLTHRPGRERGHYHHGWLDTHHTFSFGDYDDPRHRGFRSLRVLNEDRVAPGRGFGLHPHRDMEIVTLVLSGALAHRDSLGSGSILEPGDIQRMTAGRGLMHSEANPSPSEPVHFLQVWLRPQALGLEPSYAQQRFATPAPGELTLVVSPDGRLGSLSLEQNATISRGRLDQEHPLRLTLAPTRHGWLQVVSGQLTVADHSLTAGDGLAVSDERELVLTGTSPAEIVWFDLA